MCSMLLCHNIVDLRPETIRRGPITSSSTRQNIHNWHAPLLSAIILPLFAEAPCWHAIRWMPTQLSNEYIFLSSHCKPVLVFVFLFTIPYSSVHLVSVSFLFLLFQCPSQHLIWVSFLPSFYLTCHNCMMQRSLLPCISLSVLNTLWL